MLRNVVHLLMVFSFLGFSQNSKADDLSVFLKSCAYGTAAGAVLGLASVAISEDPSGKMSNVARGASLGLYAGIGFGLYTIYGSPAANSSDYSMEMPSQQIWFSALQTDRRLEGAQINWATISF